MTYKHYPEECGCIDGHPDFCPYNPSAENYDPELTKKMLESKISKPDFEAISIAIYQLHSEGMSTRGMMKLMAERIWKERQKEIDALKQELEHYRFEYLAGLETIGGISDELKEAKEKLEKVNWFEQRNKDPFDKWGELEKLKSENAELKESLERWKTSF